MSDENLDANTRIRECLKGPRSETKPLAKTRDLSPWYGYKNAAMAAFLWPSWRATRQFLTRDLVSSSRTSFCLYKAL